MISVIMAVDENFGYSKDSRIPWKNKDDLQNFKNTTKGHIVVMGRKTWESLPVKPLPDRLNIVISSNFVDERCLVFRNLEIAVELCKNYPEKEIFVIGGAQLVYEALKHSKFRKIILTIVKGKYDCDQFLNILPLESFVLLNEIPIENAVIKEYIGNFLNVWEEQYLTLCKKILKDGSLRKTRNGNTLSLFGEQIVFNIENGFPLLTTKKMFFRGIVEELLFFIRGKTNSKLLEEKGINIWKGNTSQQFLEDQKLNYHPGDMGPMYGFQWRFFNAKYEGCDKDYKCDKDSFDQLATLIDEIKHNKMSRRLLMTSYNPLQNNEGVLTPCHGIVIQFYVNNDKLSCKMYQRSADVFLGLPFNIASYALFLEIIAKECNLKAENVIITLGDVHIYEEHVQQVQEQITRFPHPFPKLKIKAHKKFDDYVYEDFELIGYHSYPSLKAEFKP